MTSWTGCLLAGALVLVVAGIVDLSARRRVHAFVVLLLASLVYGAFAAVLTGTPGFVDTVTGDGIAVPGLITVIARGFGDTLASMGIVVILGSFVGLVLDRGGGAFVMAECVLHAVGRRRVPLAMGIAGYIVAAAVLCNDTGFIILSGLARAIALDAGISTTIMTTSLATGLYASHAALPPTPGPLAAATTLGADIGLVLLLGLVVSIPAMLVGVLFARRCTVQNVSSGSAEPTEQQLLSRYSRLPGPMAAFAPIVIPVALITASSIGGLPRHLFGTGIVRTILAFIGNPVAALTIGAAIAVLAVGHEFREALGGWMGEAVKNAAPILVIAGAGGALGAVIRASGLGGFLGVAMSAWHMGLLLPFLIAAAVKTAQGSSTVALITVSAIVAPLMSSLGWTTPGTRALAVLAIGAGSMIVCHANDSYFWVVSQFGGMDTRAAWRNITVGSMVGGLAMFAGVLALSLVVH